MSSNATVPATPDSGAPVNGEEARRYATFHVAGLFFGIDVLKVQEVLQYQEMTQVPLAPEVVQGLINLRGQIVTALDMRRRLGLPDRGPSESPMNIVVRTDDGAVSLLVDEIGNVVDCPGDAYEQPPENMPVAQRTLIDGVYKLEGKLLLILNTRMALDAGPAQ